ncbi:MAG: glycoside hydrolase family 2 protein [Lachnospiraceae bacterium]|nr:glycoside hydrolase family 2 protein [Lachnospiraceae bacterium]
MEQRIYLNNGWYFSDAYHAGMEKTDYRYEEETPVRIPHTVAVTPLHYFDEHEYQKISAYFKTFNVPAAWMDKDVYLTFDGVAHSCVVYINGKVAGEHFCGYTALTLNIKDLLDYGHENLIMVRVNSREDQNIPPFGFVIDYMTYGGIYRDVYLEVKDPAHVEDAYVSGDMDGRIRLDFTATAAAAGKKLTVSVGGVTLGEEILQTGNKSGEDAAGDQADNAKNQADTAKEPIHLLREYAISSPLLWSPEVPNLYTIKMTLEDEFGVVSDEKEVRFGFRTAVFKEDGFYLNGEKYKIRGLNRHQSYPYVGYAMPKNPQRNDVYLLKKELGLNAVRTSHYPQSHHFLEACDEMGLLVFTEIPGWQHIGDETWKLKAIKNTEDMVLQYRNHPSIILWGVRINESVDDDDFYKRTNEAAHRLDPVRQTGGVRCYKKMSLLEDVYTYNDFVHSGDNQGCDTKKSVTSDTNKGYLISEYMGHMFPTKAFDWEEKRLEDAIRHARVLNDVAKNDDIAGSFGWCMFDYNTHKDFGSGDRICYHGVMDMFRNPKMAAYVYAEMQDAVPVLALSSTMDIGEHHGCNRNETYIFTNADSVKMYKNDNFIKEYVHDNKQFSHLKNPPIKIDDYIGDALKAEKMTPAQERDVKIILNEVAKFGLYQMTTGSKLKAAKLMTFHHMSMTDAVELYNKYIGDWGGASVSYRFEAIKDGKVVKTLRIAPMTQMHLEVECDRVVLKEIESYDVACVRIRALDENGNTLCYYNDPVMLSVEGNAELIGPSVIGLSGGRGGTYIKSVGKAGNAKLTVSDVNGRATADVEFKIQLEP